MFSRSAAGTTLPLGLFLALYLPSTAAAADWPMDRHDAGRTAASSQELAATIVGAVVGAVAGYLLFTEHGRSVRRQIETALEDFSRELMSFQNTVQKAAGVANEGWNLLNDAFGEREKPPTRYPRGQTSTFGGRTHVR